MTADDPDTSTRSVAEEIRRHRVVAILRGVPIEHVVALGDALWEGGIRLLEVTFTDDDAADKIGLLGENFGGEALVGGGTVTNATKAQHAVEAGARFLITPHVIQDVNEFGRVEGIDVISGALTPGEIAQAREQGNTIVKLFPATTMGPGYLRALLGPYPDAQLMAVGGIGENEVQPYLEAGAVAVGIGGALTNLDWRAPDFGRAQEYATRLVQRAAKGRQDES